MKLNSRYNFNEALLGENFASNTLKNFKELIEASRSFVTISMPGVGASYFLKYLSTQKWAFFVHVDMYSLPNLSQHEFYKLLFEQLGGKPGKKNDEELLVESKKILQTLSLKNDKIVIIFNRFDQLKKEFDWNFLSNIQSLSTISSAKIVLKTQVSLIFTSIKPLHEISPDALKGGNLTFYSKNLYFKPYSKEDLKKLLKIDPEQPPAEADLDKLIELSGGHNQLLHILLNSQKQNNLLLDQFVKLQLKELVDYLDYSQRKQLQKIALGKKVSEVDEYLLGVGMVEKVGQTYKTFTPLLSEYIRANLPVKLAVKESKLFKLLRNNMGRVIGKDEIFASVWNESEETSDWALDALIYRLRKHPFIQASGYIIESHKKVGYTLIQT